MRGRPAPRVAFLAYNAACYVLFVLAFAGEGAQWLGSLLSPAVIVDSLTVAREFGICLVLVAFVLILRHHVGQDGFADPSRNELRLLWESPVLTIIGLVRESFTLVEPVLM
jgi:hypothetical protein